MVRLVAKNKEKLVEIAITTVNAECSAYRFHGTKFPKKLEIGEFFLSHKLEIEALTPTRMTLELANRSILTDGHAWMLYQRVPIILGRPFLRTAKALIDLYEEKLTLRVGKDELVYYADKSEKNKEKNFVHAISVIDFSKDDPFSGSRRMKLALPLNSLPPGNDDSTLKKDLHEENFQEDVEIKNSNVSDKLVFLNTPLSDKDECFAPEDDNDEIDDFLAIEVSSNLEEGYFDSEGDIAFLDNLLSDDDSHNLDSKVTSDHEPEQNESSITFSPRSDPLHHEFAGEPLTLPARNDREFEEYLSLMTVLNEISTSQGNFHQNSVIESLPMSPILVEDSDPTQEEIDILLVPDNLIPPMKLMSHLTLITKMIRQFLDLHRKSSDMRKVLKTQSGNFDNQSVKGHIFDPGMSLLLRAGALSKQLLVLRFNPTFQGILSCSMPISEALEFSSLYGYVSISARIQSKKDTRMDGVIKKLKISKRKQRDSCLSIFYSPTAAKTQLDTILELDGCYGIKRFLELAKGGGWGWEAKCYVDEPLAVSLDGLHFDDKLQFVEEPVEIIDREVNWLKRSCIPLVKVRWNSRRGPEFTWEREDQFRKKYPHLFTKTASSSNSVMSDSDESGVTYTEVSSPFEGLSDIGSPRADDHEYLELPNKIFLD
ncbi:hypothetical protein Tco_0843556 [Tanacetum coccineum]|uniref:Reverse transcriptase domain-containing protein n=1 Tax=Tanacetum coccineum TaxID=301880 RepID=A0ABQ5B4A2_9ASTR